MDTKQINHENHLIVKSASDFTSCLEKLFNNDDLLFRGQSEDNPLLPKIARLTLKENIISTEQTMLREFKIQALPFIHQKPENDWDWLALAQHHGMATRLLDWSGNPITALWFAVRNPPKTDKHGVVWVFETKFTDYGDSQDSPFEIKQTHVFRPRHITKRIIAQDGWFTVHKFIISKNKFIPLEKNKAYSKKLKKILIPASSFADIRRELDRWGFNHANMNSDLDGLCKQIEWQNSLLADEK